MMYTEKNCFDVIVGTILGQEGKSKDNYKARLDLEEMGIRKDLHVRRSNSTNILLPKACYQMTLQEKDAFLKVLKELKLPDECSTNISRCVQLKQRKLIGLKSYDCHILLQEFIPIAIRGSLPDNVTSVIIKICNIFKSLCSRVLDPRELEQLEASDPQIMCELEKIFSLHFLLV